MRIVSILLLLALVLTCGTAFASDSVAVPIQKRLDRVERWVDRQFQPGADNCELLYQDGDGWLVAVIYCQAKIGV